MTLAIGLAIFWFAVSFAMAAVEIEIEGAFGWAEKLPTWYHTSTPGGRLYGALMNGKPLTGYHLFMPIVILLFFHTEFAFGVAWTAARECQILAAFFLISVYWDFLWFVLNPFWGIKRFAKFRIWWHAASAWIGRMPLFYLTGVVLSVLSALGAGALTKLELFTRHLIVIGILILLIPPTAVYIAPRYHRWYWAMRKINDRDKANIFHDFLDQPLGQE